MLKRFFSKTPKSETGQSQIEQAFCKDHKLILRCREGLDIQQQPAADDFSILLDGQPVTIQSTFLQRYIHENNSSLILVTEHLWRGGEQVQIRYEPGVQFMTAVLKDGDAQPSLQPFDEKFELALLEQNKFSYNTIEHAADKGSSDNPAGNVQPDYQISALGIELKHTVSGLSSAQRREADETSRIHTRAEQPTEDNTEEIAEEIEMSDAKASHTEVAVTVEDVDHDHEIEVAATDTEQAPPVTDIQSKSRLLNLSQTLDDVLNVANINKALYERSSRIKQEQKKEQKTEEAIQPVTSSSLSEPELSAHENQEVQAEHDIQVEINTAAEPIVRGHQSEGIELDGGNPPAAAETITPTDVVTSHDTVASAQPEVIKQQRVLKQHSAPTNRNNEEPAKVLSKDPAHKQRPQEQKSAPPKINKDKSEPQLLKTAQQPAGMPQESVVTTQAPQEPQEGTQKEVQENSDLSLERDRKRLIVNGIAALNWKRQPVASDFEIEHINRRMQPRSVYITKKSLRAAPILVFTFDDGVPPNGVITVKYTAARNGLQHQEKGSKIAPFSVSAAALSFQVDTAGHATKAAETPAAFNEIENPHAVTDTVVTEKQTAGLFARIKSLLKKPR